MSTESYDVIIVGAGISGIGAGVHLQKHCPGKSFTILEARAAIGGTWDLFRYPGIRSDSDMHTFGYRFKPWKDPKTLADGPSIRTYVRETAEEFGIIPHIRFGHTVRRAEWSSATSTWEIEAEVAGQPVRLTARYLMMCSGYYRYDAGHTPDFAGRESFNGQLIHPQRWPEDLDYTGKQVVVIGSGATAVTLVPAMAEKAARVTMLQRSPTYLFSLPAVDIVARLLKKILPLRLAYGVTRWKNIVLQMVSFNFLRRFPALARRRLISLIRAQLGPEFDVETHFSPRYNPWDERLCVVPDNDLFEAINAGKVEVVTDQVETFTPEGVRLASGRQLAADIIVTATGLELQFAGGAEIAVDGQPIDTGKVTLYKGALFSGVPNFLLTFGYTNASWTLRADLLAEYFCRLINFMDRHGYVEVRPPVPDGSISLRPAADLKSGYFKRAEAILPRQGDRGPWRNPQNYAFDILRFRFGALRGRDLHFR